MISFWASAKSLHIPVKAGVLEAICLEQTWPLSLISQLSASIFLSVPELYCTCFSPSVSLKFFLFCSSLLFAPFFFPTPPPSSSFVILHFLPPSCSLPPGCQGQREFSGPAKGAEPANRGDPQGARWNSRPFGPARRGAPQQGRRAVRQPPAPVVTGAGNPGGVGVEHL